MNINYSLCAVRYGIMSLRVIISNSCGVICNRASSTIVGDVAHSRPLEGSSKAFFAKSSRKLDMRAWVLFGIHPLIFSHCAGNGALAVATNTILVSSVGVRGLAFSNALDYPPSVRRMLVGMISTLCSRRCHGDGAKAVISIGRPYKFAVRCYGGRETSSGIKTIHAARPCRGTQRGDTCWLPRDGIQIAKLW